MNKSQIPGVGDTGDSEVNNEKIEEFASTEKTARTLAEKFPAAFARPHPLKIGIFADIVAATTITPEALTAFLAEWCGDPRYLRKIRAGKSRVDLQGRPAGEVTEQEESCSKMRAFEKFLQRARTAAEK